MIGYDNDGWPGHEPQRVEAEERVVEAALLWVVLQGEERRVDEHQPTHRTEHDEPVARQRFVSVQNLKKRVLKYCAWSSHHVLTFPGSKYLVSKTNRVACVSVYRQMKTASFTEEADLSLALVTL